MKQSASFKKAGESSWSSQFIRILIFPKLYFFILAETELYIYIIFSLILGNKDAWWSQDLAVQQN